ncbi:MAG: EpsG family protein [Paludibacteraceae bacterium]|nr:EpsG family protein [Paludibacteraceae bacterium]
MNIFSWLFVYLMAASIAEFALQRDYPKICQQLYGLSFAVALFVVLIKYYYGSDIGAYILWYDKAGDFGQTASRAYVARSEILFFYYLDICKRLHLTLWMSTIPLTLLYFFSIAQLFKSLKRFKVFALTLLMILDFNLIVLEARQCMAVSFVILAVLSADKRKYALSLLLLLMATFSHKSGLPMAVIIAIMMLLRSVKIDHSVYWVALVILTFAVFLPNDFVSGILAKAHVLSSERSQSLLHHAGTTVRFQAVLAVYLLAMLCMALSKPAWKTDTERWAWIVLFGFVLLAVLYRNWFLVNRLRSYLLPFMIVYAFNMVDENHVDQIVSQVTACVLFLFCVYSTYKYSAGLSKPEGITSADSTVLERFSHSEEELRARQAERARYYWNHYYTKYYQSEQ